MKSSIPFWVPFESGIIPKNAVIGGHYFGQKIFIGRAVHNGSLTPGMILENEKVLIIPWGCVSNRKEENFEILLCESEPKWIVAQDGHAPLNAFPAGHSEYSNETLFIGRYKHGDSVVCGKVQPSHRCAYIAYGTQELNNRLYEVLVV
ncbi:hypothetical protein PVAND_004409 [Polypedilum vanderplanki]|uniref:Uncharacterized protein n=1 Tax=Polypedilum vanderplanki TaxID=319348 RepID=A0A9J6BZ18_POLVA|nr:hypothetical protein PVAND_004409 [Polypedilum vanderplanki]